MELITFHVKFMGEMGLLDRGLAVVSSRYYDVIDSSVSFRVRKKEVRQN